MANENTIIRTIASVQFPGVYLQLDGKDVTSSSDGSKTGLSVGHGAGPLEQFRLSPPPTDGAPYRTLIESVAYPGVYLRMDARGVTESTEPGGGIVNKQFGFAAYEWFILRPRADGTYAIESEAFPGVFLRLSMGSKSGEKGPVVNCQKGAYGYELFRLETPPATKRLRVLSYNTHLMQDSFLETGTDAARIFSRSPYAVFEDQARRDLIMRFVLESLADIVSLQEVWSLKWEADFIEALRHAYPYAYRGGIKSALDPRDALDPIGALAPLVVTPTSGLVLCSKYELLPNPFFQSFPNMGSPDNLSNKGALGATANIPGFGKLRIGTAHTTGESRDIQFLADKAVNDSAEHRALPAIMMGDFNMSWTPGGTKTEYVQLKKILSFPGTDLHAASDAWIEVHGQKTDPDPYTIKMRENTLHQLFSPQRDTEPDDRMDYLWVKPGK
jgi:endonuclease/exonuclease/phosphatase family metal-dependent hydrolase